MTDEALAAYLAAVVARCKAEATGDPEKIAAARAKERAAAAAVGVSTLFDLPAEPYAGTTGWSGSDTSRARAEDRVYQASMQVRLVLAVFRSGAQGLTAKEARRTVGVIEGGGVSGALSTLHRVGALSRLAQTRGDHGTPNKVYVWPTFVNGRLTEAHGRRSAA